LTTKKSRLPYYTLPDPVGLRDDEGNWMQIPRISRTIPFGYVSNANDADILDPVYLELEALDLARQYVKEYSYREVARWLSDKTGRSISHVGLRKRVNTERKRKNKAKAYRNWLATYKKALTKLEELEIKHTGSKEKSGSKEESGATA
jgi:hypothetical protein